MKDYLIRVLNKFGFEEAKYEILAENKTNKTFLIFYNEFYILKIAFGENAIITLKKEVEILSELSILQKNIPMYLLSKDNKRVEILNINNQLLGSSLYLMKKGIPIEFPDDSKIEILIPNLITLNKNLKIIGEKTFVNKVNLNSILKESYNRYKMYKISIFDDVYIEMSEYLKQYKSRYQLIHGDLHYGNFLINKKEINFIDFRDCHFGDVLFEFSSLLLPPFNDQKVIKKLIFGLLDANILNELDVINLNLVMAIKYFSLILNVNENINEIQMVQTRNIQRIIKEYLINYNDKKEVYNICP